MGERQGPTTRHTPEGARRAIGNIAIATKDTVVAEFLLHAVNDPSRQGSVGLLILFCTRAYGGHGVSGAVSPRIAIKIKEHARLVSLWYNGRGADMPEWIDP